MATISSSPLSTPASTSAESIDWIFNAALLKRCFLPLSVSFFIFHFTLSIFSSHTTFFSQFTMKLILFLLIVWINIAHFAYLHSYTTLNYRLRNQKIISSSINIVFGWIIGNILHQILFENQCHNCTLRERYFLKIGTSFITILTLWSCSYFSQPLVPKSIIPPSLSLLFRHTIVTSLKRIAIHVFCFLVFLVILTIIFILGVKSSSTLSLKFLYQGFISTLILHLIYSVINSTFSILITYPMNFSKLKNRFNSPIINLQFAVTGQSPHLIDNGTKHISSNSLYPFHLQYLPSSSSSSSSSSSLSFPIRSSSSLASSTSSMIPTISSNDYNIKWKNIYLFQNQINNTLFNYLEQNYHQHELGCVSSWFPNYEPFLLPTLYHLFRIDVTTNQNSQKSKSWSSLPFSMSPMVFVSYFITPIRSMYYSLRQTLALHDLSRIARSSFSSPRKQQLFHTSESLSTLTHALLTLVNSATLQIDILTCHGEIELLDTVGHKSNLLATFYSHLLDSNPVKLPPPKHWFLALILRILKWFNSIIKFSNYFHQSRLQEAVNYEISPSLNVTNSTTTSNEKIEKMDGKNSSLSLFYKRRQEREATLSGALLNALISLFPTISSLHINAVPFSSPLTISFTEDTIAAIESLTSLLINESHPRQLSSSISSSSSSSSSSVEDFNSFHTYSHHYLPIILSSLISLELQLKNYLNYRVLFYYSHNCSSFHQYLDSKLSPGIYFNIHQFNLKSSISSPLSSRIISESLSHLEHVIDVSINQIILKYHDIILSTYSYPTQISQRIKEIIKKRKIEGGDQD